MHEVFYELSTVNGCFGPLCTLDEPQNPAVLGLVVVVRFLYLFKFDFRRRLVSTVTYEVRQNQK